MLPAVAVAQQITTAASTVAISPRQVQVKVSVGPGGSLLYVNEAGESQPLPESGLWCVPGTAQAFAVQPDEGYVVSSVSFNGQQREGMMRTFSVIPGKDSELNVLFVSEADAGLTDTTPGWHQTAFGSSYWRDKNGRLAMGKRTIEDKTYVFTSGGLMVTGWRNLSEGWFYFGEDGVMRTGWFEAGSSTYHANESGVMSTGWQLFDDGWAFFRSNGVLVLRGFPAPCEGWCNVNDSWYLFDGSGKMLTGWQAVGGVWYFFGENGKMLTGWQIVNGSWYNLAESGALRTGWYYHDGWYWLGDDGAMRSGWFMVNGVWYATRASGQIITDAWASDGSGYDYYFDESGAWTGARRTHVA